jgi:hypothetical protein
MCFSTFSSNISIVFSFYIKMGTKSIIMNTPLACSWCMSGSYQIAGLTGVERAVCYGFFSLTSHLLYLFFIINYLILLDSRT